jgi:hypothetical protein
MLHLKEIPLNADSWHSGISSTSAFKRYEGHLDQGSDLETQKAIDSVISAASKVGDMDFFVHAYSLGTYRIFKSQERDPRFQVIWYAPNSPRARFHWLYQIGNAYRGIVQVLEPSELLRTVTSLAPTGTELLVVSKQTSSKVRELFSLKKWDATIGEAVANDDRYFCLGYDCDTAGGPSNWEAWIAHGRNCPDSLVASIQPLLTELGQP